jgi:hypothetical protein
LPRLGRDYLSVQTQNAALIAGKHQLFVDKERTRERRSEAWGRLTPKTLEISLTAKLKVELLSP